MSDSIARDVTRLGIERAFFESNDTMLQVVQSIPCSECNPDSQISDLTFLFFRAEHVF